MPEATMSTGDISRRLGFPVTTELLSNIGHAPSGQDKRASLWPQSEWPAICQAMSEYCARRVDVPMQPKPPKPPTKRERDALEAAEAAKAQAPSDPNRLSGSAHPPKAPAYDLDDI